ncbi:hypothetical protein F511_31595 [Dorcoceras hygrometricum]|uniref:Uncharacterized protein n=1 Tax=Dorcoceras hygrometricum TaxID=472368 RepID=A0A2Z7D2I5_9LAMI|nr:hypothetical protein F511_31595 [Dorcoceras hygrometricum]
MRRRDQPLVFTFVLPAPATTGRSPTSWTTPRSSRSYPDQPWPQPWLHERARVAEERRIALYRNARYMVFHLKPMVRP